MIRFSLDGREVEAAPGESIWSVAEREGVAIPHLCHLPQPGYRPDGNCRACMVEVEGERVLAASCIRAPREGMVVRTASERAERTRRMVFELLLADQPGGAEARDDTGTFARWAHRLGLHGSRFAPEHERPAPDLSHPAMAVRLDACIQCGLCERACREVQHNDVIGMARRGMDVTVSFDLLDPMGVSSCVACGECVQACPTGALLPKTVLDAAGRRAAAPPEREVASVCPYCGVGCQVGFRVRDGAIEEVVGRDGPANRNRLCVKGRFGFDYLRHPDRLTRAARPRGRRRQGAGRLPRPAPRARQVPRSLLGGGAGPRRRRPRAHPRRARPGRARPASAPPRAPTRRRTCSRSWSAPASAPTTWTTARASATPPPSPRCWRASAPAPSPRRSWPRRTPR